LRLPLRLRGELPITGVPFPGWKRYAPLVRWLSTGTAWSSFGRVARASNLLGKQLASARRAARDEENAMLGFLRSRSALSVLATAAVIGLGAFGAPAPAQAGSGTKIVVATPGVFVAIGDSDHRRYRKDYDYKRDYRYKHRDYGYRKHYKRDHYRRDYGRRYYKDRGYYGRDRHDRRDWDRGRRYRY
jgi:hypothetical protein